MITTNQYTDEVNNILKKIEEKGFSTQVYYTSKE
jgi:hypothetical protein